MEQDVFNILPYSFHDGCVEDAWLTTDRLYLQVFRGANPCVNKDDENTKYMRLLFCGVSEVEVYDYDSRSYVKATEDHFLSEKNDSWKYYINALDYDEGKIVFEESLRFACKKIIVLEAAPDAFENEMNFN